MKYGYARVSTESQSLSTQLQLLKQVGVDEIFQEKYTRTTTKRPEFARLIFTVFSAFAQFERDMIVTRTQKGKSYARRHNPKYHEGRPKVYSDEKIWQAYQLHQKGMTYRELSLRTGISISTLRRRFTLIKSVEIRDHEK